MLHSLPRCSRRLLHIGVDRIAVSDLQCSCVVGIYSHERRRPQPLRVDIEMDVDLQPAASTEDCARTVDYFAVAEQARFVVEAGRFQLLETAAQSIARLLLAVPAPDEQRASVQAVRVTLSKPDALAGSAVPSVSIWREANDEQSARHGAVEVIHETVRAAGAAAAAAERAGVYRAVLEPGGALDHESSVCWSGLSAEKAVAMTLMPLCSGARVDRGCAATETGSSVLEALRPLGLEFPWRIENPTERHQTLLLVRPDAG